MLATSDVNGESFMENPSSTQFPHVKNAVFSAHLAQQNLDSLQQISHQKTDQYSGLLKDQAVESKISDSSSANAIRSNDIAALFPSSVSLPSYSSAENGSFIDSKLKSDSQNLLEEGDKASSPFRSSDTTLIDSSNSVVSTLLETTAVGSATQSKSLISNSLGYSDGSITISKDLASIWSSPPTNAVKSQLTNQNLTLDDAIMYGFPQQQHQSEGWLGQQVSSFNGPTKPPPGLGNALSFLQKQEQAGIGTHANNLNHKLPLRRSQSAMLNRSSLLNLSAYQPGLANDLGNSTDQIFNDTLATTQSLPFSPWSNTATALANSSLQSPLSSTSLNANQFSMGSAGLAHSTMAHPMLPPPKLHRSISTPAAHSSPLNAVGLMPSLDDNPFFKASYSAALNGHMLGNSSSLNFNDFDSKLSEIIKAESLQSGFMPQSTRSLGKWKDMNSDTIFEDALFSPSVFGSTAMMGEMNTERFSRKVFVGGLPPDIDEDEIRATFMQFGPLVVDWPHKAESKSYFPPKGYAFLLFKEEASVQNLIRCCMKEREKLYLRVSSPTIRDKPVQIRPWKLTDSDFVLDGSQPLDPRKTVFVGGVPRPLRACELAILMERLYGGVCYAGIDVDPDLKYPKGAGRVAFSNHQSYMAAISARFAHLQHGDIDKRVEVKPYVLDDQHCDECHGTRCGGKFAPFFCANVACLRYYCDHCWITSHSRPGMETHRPMVKEGAERFAKSIICRW